MTAVADLFPEYRDFSLILGGPLYQLFQKVHIADPAKHLKFRVAIITGVIWVPLLVLCAIEGTLMRGVDIPFLTDIETHARFLVCVPLMLIAELVVHQRVRDMIQRFVEHNLIPAAAMDRFRAAIRRAMAWRNSISAEVILALLVLTVGYYVRTHFLALKSSTWYASVGPDGARLTLAGFWFAWFSNPVMQFLMLRWLYRILIWARLLFQISRIDLDLIPTHPDRNAGLGFLSLSAFAYAPLLAAFGAAVAGLCASRIFHEGAKLVDFKIEIGAVVGVGILMVLGPLLVFAPQIMTTKRRGLAEYGAFAAEFTRTFGNKWLHRGGGEVLGNHDIESLADLSNAYTIIREIKAVPFNKDTLIQLAVATAAPFVPLVFTMIPAEELFKRILKAVI